MNKLWQEVLAQVIPQLIPLVKQLLDAALAHFEKKQPSPPTIVDNSQ